MAKPLGVVEAEKIIKAVVKPSGNPIIVQWRDLLTNIKDKGDRCTITGAAWRVDNAFVYAVEAEYVVLDSIDNSTPRRHFVALDSIAVISR